MVQRARESGVAVWGPNCGGFVNTANGLLASFIDLPRVRKGGIGIVAQSGIYVAGLFNQLMERSGFGVSTVASLGNACDVNAADVFEYLAEDPATSVIALHLEGLAGGSAAAARGPVRGGSQACGGRCGRRDRVGGGGEPIAYREPRGAGPDCRRAARPGRDRSGPRVRRPRRTRRCVCVDGNAATGEKSRDDQHLGRRRGDCRRLRRRIRNRDGATCAHYPSPSGSGAPLRSRRGQPHRRVAGDGTSRDRRRHAGDRRCGLSRSGRRCGPVRHGRVQRRRRRFRSGHGGRCARAFRQAGGRVALRSVLLARRVADGPRGDRHPVLR